jgi:hypothetical protein
MKDSTRAAIKRLLDLAARENWPRDVRVAAIERLLIEAGER